MMASDVLALDIGMRCGFAVGAPGRIPESGTVVLKIEKSDASVAFSNLLAFLVARFDAGPPRLVVKEQLIFGPRVHAGAGGAAYRSQYGLHAIVEAVCVRFGLTFENGRIYDVADGTWRKHFTGKGRWGDRDSGKLAVLARARLLGYIDADLADDNRADACGVWDWAATHLARKPPRELVLFGEPRK